MAVCAASSCRSDRLDLSVSPASRAGLVSYDAACDDVRRHIAANGGDVLCHRRTWSRYPHIMVRHGDLVWTSVHLALRK